jgi:hydroxymethylpyrimidine pyrophosphatase-like HAD family hydrolase
VTDRHLFVIDFDGTLLNDDRAVSFCDMETLARLRDKGVVVAIATGRSLYSFQRALAQIRIAPSVLPVDYLIFSTGAGIQQISRNQLLRHLAISRPDVIRITACFERRQLDYMVHKAIPDTHFFLYRSHGRDNPDFFHRISLYAPFAAPLDPDTPLYGAATQVLAVVPRKGRAGQQAELVAQIRAELAGYSVVHATSPLDHRSGWIEVFHHRASKSRAAAWLAAQLNILRSRVTAVGNDYNDLDLLEWAGQGFWVANAPPEIDTGVRMPVSNNDSGVTRAAVLSGLLAK